MLTRRTKQDNRKYSNLPPYSFPCPPIPNLTWTKQGEIVKHYIHWLLYTYCRYIRRKKEKNEGMNEERQTNHLQQGRGYLVERWCLLEDSVEQQQQQLLLHWGSFSWHSCHGEVSVFGRKSDSMWHLVPHTPCDRPRTLCHLQLTLLIKYLLISSHIITSVKLKTKKTKAYHDLGWVVSFFQGRQMNDAKEQQQGG